MHVRYVTSVDVGNRMQYNKPSGRDSVTELPTQGAMDAVDVILDVLLSNTV